MGITDLLVTLGNLLKVKHISEYKNKRIGIDAYVWLHKSVYGGNLGMAFEENPDAFLIYLHKCIKGIIKYNITPVFVFDGDKLPLKAKTEFSRELAREARVLKAKEYLKSGDELKAKLAYIRSIEITPYMAFKFCQMLDKMKIEYYVAPYEADAQLAYMIRNKLIDAVCTEDSDLIAYGCTEVIYKLDLKSGWCKTIRYRDVFENTISKFYNWSSDMFLEYCILSGCDYFRIPGVSSKTAYKLIKKYGCFSNSKSPKYPFNLNELINQFEKAKSAFTKHIIYCPLLKIQKSLDDANILIPEYLGRIESDITIVELLVKSYISPFNYELLLK